MNNKKSLYLLQQQLLGRSEYRKKMYQSFSKPATLDLQTTAGMIQRVLENDRGQFRTPLKYSAMLALSCFALFRSDELLNLRIEDLNPNRDGFLDLHDYHGGKFGKIPALKGTRKHLPPNHSILLVPRAVEILNLYLAELYANHPELKGVGYLFRPTSKEGNPDAKYLNAKSMFSWLEKNKQYLFGDIFSAEQLNELTYNDFRRAGISLLSKKTFFQDPALEECKQDVVAFQARHVKEQRETGQHPEELTLDIYAKVIDAAFNFPFDKDELEQWEHHMFQEVLRKGVMKEKYDEEISNLHMDLKQLKRLSLLIGVEILNVNKCLIGKNQIINERGQ